MSIRIEELDGMDFSDVGDRPASRLLPTPPGFYLAELLDESGISQARFARMIGVSTMRISHIIKGSRPVTADLALRFGRAFGQSPQYWLNLQSNYDLKHAEIALESTGALAHIEPLQSEAA